MLLSRLRLDTERGALLDIVREKLLPGNQVNNFEFCFGDQARKKLLTWAEWEQYDRLKVYPLADVNINFKINIRRIGLLREGSPVRKS